jgi:hypothetical protein
MNVLSKVAVTAAAVFVAAVVGISLFPRSQGVGGPGPTPVPTPTPTPSALPSAGTLGAGTYYIPAGLLAPVRVTFAVPPGWATTGDFVTKGPAPTNTGLTSDYGSVELTTWIVTHAYTDICHWTGTLAAGVTPDAFANLLRTQKGRTASAVTDVVLGGVAAKRVELTVPADLDVTKCDPGNPGEKGIIRFWPDPGPDETGGLCCATAGSTDVVYVLSGAGKTFTVLARHQANSSAADLAELDGIVSSIKFETPAPSSSDAASPASSTAP